MLKIDFGKQNIIDKAWRRTSTMAGISKKIRPGYKPPFSTWRAAWTQRFSRLRFHVKCLSVAIQMRWAGVIDYFVSCVPKTLSVTEMGVSPRRNRVLIGSSSVSVMLHCYVTHRDLLTLAHKRRNMFDLLADDSSSLGRDLQLVRGGSPRGCS